MDRGGLIALVNEEAEELFGYTSGELIDQPVDVLISAAIRDASDRVETRREQGRAEVQRERDLLKSRLHQTHRWRASVSLPAE